VEVDIARAHTTEERDMGMADQAIDPDMSPHTRARVPALPMPDHALVVDVRAVVMVVDARSVDIRVVDAPAADVPAAAITGTKKSGVMRKATPQEWPFCVPPLLLT
jgi:hypothetical protein